MFRRLVTLIALIGAIVLPAPTIFARSVDIVRTGIFAMRTDLLVRAMAKELCSCWHVSRVGEGGPILDGVAMCLERAQLPITPGLIGALTDIEVSADALTFEVDPTLLGALAGLFQGANAIAEFDTSNPRYGCTLVSEGGQ